MITIQRKNDRERERERKASRLDRRYDTTIHINEIDDNDADNENNVEFECI